MSGKDIMWLVILIIIIIAGIIISAWWKGRLISQGKIVKRANDFMEYAEIFSLRPITNEELAAGLRALDMRSIGGEMSGNTAKAIFKCPRPFEYTAELRCVEQSVDRSVYRFEFNTWKSSHGRAEGENQMNMLLTAIEKMFVSLDSNTQVSNVKIEVKTKRSIL